MKDLYFLICGEKKLNEVIEKSDNLMKDVIEEAKKQMILALNQNEVSLDEIKRIIKNNNK